MLSKGKKLFPKASHSRVHIIYTLYVFCLVFIYFHSLFELYIYYTAFAIRAKSQNDAIKAKFLKNHFHELLHIPSHSGDSLCQEDIYFIICNA